MHASQTFTSFAGTVGAGARPRFTLMLLLTMSVLLGSAALPAAGHHLAIPAISPASAEAAQMGWDRNHAWVKIGAAEVIRGGAKAACYAAAARYAPRLSSLCPGFANAAGRILGRNRGVWAALYPWPPRLNWGVW